MILIAAATAREIAFLEPDPNLEILITGIGPVEAAARVAQALVNNQFDLVVNAGIAGALEGVANVGDGVVVATECLQLDLETGEPLSLPEGIHVSDRVTSDKTIVAELVAKGIRSVKGVTVTRVTATEATAARLRATGAQIESMEGFAVLRAAALAGVRAVEIRGISNIVGERARSRWSFSAGTAGLARAMSALLALEHATA
jgi:futalosine hydrolase